MSKCREAFDKRYANCTSEWITYAIWEHAWNAALEHAARIAQSTVCDTHIPTGVSIYGSRAAEVIREEKT